MIILEQADYEKLAGEIAGEFFTNGTPLNDGVYKVASTMGLVPAQIEQLVWNTNTKVHLDLFEKQAEDKMIEFPVADSGYVSKRLYTPMENQPLPVSSSAEKVAHDFFSSPIESTEKVAAETFVEPAGEVREATQLARAGKTIVNLRKIASELEQEKLMAYEGYREAVQKLAWEVRKSGKREEFEKDAYALHGAAALPVLLDLRAGANVKEALETEKLACAYERLVDERTPLMQKLASALSQFETTVKLARAEKSFKEKAGKYL